MIEFRYNSPWNAKNRFYDIEDNDERKHLIFITVFFSLCQNNNTVDREVFIPHAFA